MQSRISPMFYIGILLFVCNLPCWNVYGDAKVSSREEPVRLLLEPATELLARGDTAGALKLLGQVDTKGGRYYSLLLERGGIYLSVGETSRARTDFSAAYWDNDPVVSSRAHIGLGDCYRLMRFRNYDAVREYRLALRDDFTACEARYKLAMTGFALRQTDGYRMAARELAKLICIDPGYQNTYCVWRDSILDKTPAELRRIHPHLITHMAAHPQSRDWWLDIAADRYHLDQYHSALEALDEHLLYCPGIRATERHLVRGRCLLALGDSTAFEREYSSALAAAGGAGDFAVLLRDTETIFSAEENRAAQKLERPEEWRTFFHAFWKLKDPDPVTPTNERLIEHYNRLHEAERFYEQLFPHSLTQTSQAYYGELTREYIGDMGFTAYPANIFWGRSRKLALDHRGLMFLRHGPPDRIDHPDMDKAKNPTDIWRYGGARFTFIRKFGGGDFMASLGSGGNFRLAMDRESFDDPLPAAKIEGYLSDFMAAGESVEAEFYQSVLDDAVAPHVPTSAQLAVFDTLWNLIMIDTASVSRTVGPDGDYWWAAHRAPLNGSAVITVLRMEIPGHRAVARGRYRINPFGRDSLELSGISLGVPPSSGKRAHTIGTVDIVPRPSLRFTLDEVVRLYLEIYGLRPGRNGERSYVQAITVSLVGEDADNKKSLISRLWSWGGKRHTSMTMNFAKQYTGKGPASGNVDIDTSLLVPGSYQVIVTVMDSHSGQTGKVAREFELVE